MKNKYILYSLFLLMANCSYCQISLPKGFKCVSMSSESNIRDNYFSDGILRFHSEAWGREVENPADLKDFIQKSYKGKLIFKKTQDNLYWATGMYNGEYKYIVIVPSALTTIALSSKSSGTRFSNNSTWLLQEIRNNIRSSKDYYLTDYKGKSCL